MCGAHAQIASASEVSVALRLDGATRSDVQRAVWVDRTLVRAHGPRGTVHLLATDDLPRWIGALGVVPSVGSPSPEMRLDDGQVEAIVAALGEAVAQEDLTLAELDDAIVARCGDWAGERVMPAFQTLWPRWRQALGRASHRGAVCFGPPRGRTVTYASPRRWLPDLVPEPADRSVAWLVRSYLHAYGPATPAHFARWLATSTEWATRAFDDQRDAIEPVDVDGWTGWVNASDRRPTEESDTGGLMLLPYFDAYVVGSHPRELVFPGRAAERALARTQAGNYPVVVVDGVVTSVWHAARRGSRVAVTVEPPRRFSRRQRSQLDDAVARLGIVLEATPRLTLGPVTVGPHA
jgi:hypothetical protein